MKVGKVKEICRQNKYLLMRHYKGFLVAFNCGVYNLANKRNPDNDSHESNWISYRVCDFQTYITYKIPFVKTETLK